jgi:hypothetical protein
MYGAAIAMMGVRYRLAGCVSWRLYAWDDFCAARGIAAPGRSAQYHEANPVRGDSDRPERD